jgi:hypothetical protein
MKLILHPRNFRMFEERRGANFIVVTNSSLAKHVEIERDSLYESYATVPFSTGDNLEEILSNLPEWTDVFLISPEQFITSPPDEVVGPHRRLIALACSSTPTNFAALRYFVEVIERTDPYQQQDFADRFFSLGEASDQLEIVNKQYGTVATFRHKSANYLWQQQAGPLDWGGQQINPAGEISVVPQAFYEFKQGARLAITGEIPWKGYPIVHAGQEGCPAEEQAHLYEALSCIKDHAIIAIVDDGVIVQLKETHPSVRPARAALQKLIDHDPRYGVIFEAGHGFNPMPILAGNHAPNEVYGGNYGAIHFGLGLTPSTPYHLDLICPELIIVGKDAQVLCGPGAPLIGLQSSEGR